MSSLSSSSAQLSLAQLTLRIEENNDPNRLSFVRFVSYIFRLNPA